LQGEPLNKTNQSKEEIEKILNKEIMGFLGLCSNGIPYVVPMTYGYSNGKILLHCALKGTKLEYIRMNPNVCFTVGWQSGKTIRHPQGASCKANHDSVICYGTARIIEDVDERCKVLNIFNRCLQPDAKEIEAGEVSKCLAIEIRINKMTSRQQRKGLEHTYWEYSFE
jgi:nitroimidazol reductase NimA-like FMN-containing flavoprotein (pyridoxamine 5'-phosphate oxidase superfamily)